MFNTVLNASTFKTRMSSIVVLLVLVAAGMVAYVSLNLVEQRMHSVVGQQQFSLLSSAAAYIDEDLNSKKGLLVGLREEIGHSGHSELGEIQGFIEAHSSLRDEFFNVLALDDKGNVIANLNDRRVIGKANFAQRAYFTDTLASAEGVISQPFKSSLSGKPVVIITEPVFDNEGKLIFLLCGAIDLQRPRFFGQLQALKLGASGYLFMLTRSGTIIHHPETSRILMNVKTEPGGPVPSTLAAMNGFEGWVEAKSKRGVNAIISYKQLHQTDWIIGAVYPVHEAFAPVIDVRKSALIASALVAAVAGIAGWLAIMRLLRPLGDLREHVARISTGEEDIDVLDIARKDEFGELSRAFYALSLLNLEAENNLKILARTDPLTGIHNRRKFEEVFELAIARTGRTSQPLALAYLDIDRFKQINDTHGHGVGDRVLIEFANRLKNSVRITDTVARLAGDEFVVIFENVLGPNETHHLATKILAAMTPEFNFAGLALNVTTSIGIAVSTAGCGDASSFVDAADKALYAAKRAGRNGYAVLDIADPIAG